MKRKIAAFALVLACLVIPSSVKSNGKTQDIINSFSEVHGPEVLSRGYVYTKNKDLFSIDIYAGSCKSSGYSITVVSAAEANGKVTINIRFNTPDPNYLYLDVITFPHAHVDFKSSTATTVEVVDQRGKQWKFLEDMLK